MSEKRQRKRFIDRIRGSWVPYWQATLDLLSYETIAVVLKTIFVRAIYLVTNYLLKLAGRVAVTSGDFGFLFTSWQGWLLIIATIVIVLGYMTMDINTKILYTSDLVKGEKISIRKNLKDAIVSWKKFASVPGILLIIYITLIVPVAGFGLSISLTENFYIPTFITSVIKDRTLYYVPYVIFMIVFWVIGFIYIFCIHGVLLDDMSVMDALRNSRKLVLSHKKDYIKQHLLFIFNLVLLFIILLIFGLFIPFVISELLMGSSEVWFRFLLIFFLTAGIVVFSFFNGYIGSYYLIKITELYYTYQTNQRVHIPNIKRKKHTFAYLMFIASFLFVLGFSFILNIVFNDVFHSDVSVKVIAHRAGGTDAPENTIKGIETAYEEKAFGSEIDIQRTKDGYYIVNHDTTFERLSHVKKKPQDMTLAEIKELRVQDPNYPDSPQPIATIEEMLDAAKGKVKLFIELKGSTADIQMAEDTIRLMRERDMLDECVLISLKYDLIAYIEDNYPEIETGYLTFASFGDTASLKCDYLGLEEESASSVVITRIHEQNKKVMVWTVNTPDSQKYFLKRNVDAIITDKVNQANGIIDKLEKRSDFELIFDLLLN